MCQVSIGKRLVEVQEHIAKLEAEKKQVAEGVCNLVVSVCVFFLRRLMACVTLQLLWRRLRNQIYNIGTVG